MLKFYVQSRCTPKRLIHAAAALALSLGCLAQDAAEPEAASQPDQADGETAVHLLDSETRWMQDYMASKPAKDALWLGEGEAPFIAFSQQAVNPKQLGILLLGNTPSDLTGRSWQRHLYDNLPLRGWSALATLVPRVNIEPAATARQGATADAGNPANAAPDNTTDSTANTTDATDTSGTADSSSDTAGEESDGLQKAQTRLLAASRWLLDQGARSFAIASDEHSIEVAVTSCIANADNCSGIILWRVAETRLSNLPLEKLQQSRVSVLDVLDGQPQGNMRLLRKRHFDAAGFDKDYQPIVLPQADGAATWALATKRLRHWLDGTFASE